MRFSYITLDLSPSVRLPRPILPPLLPSRPPPPPPHTFADACTALAAPFAAPQAACFMRLAAEVGMDWDETGVGWKRRRERRAEEERRRRTGEEENRRRMVLAKGVGMTRCEIMRQEE